MQGIVDCTGKKILIGDKVRTPDGRVIKVCGGMVMDETIFNAAKCHIVSKDTPTTESVNKLGGEMSDPTKEPYVQGKTPHTNAAPIDVGSDCVVWGT